MAAEKNNALVTQQETDWRPRVFLIGGLIGTMLGVLSAYFYIRAAEQRYGSDKPPEAPGPSDTVKLGISLLSIVRTITEWGNR